MIVNKYLKTVLTDTAKQQSDSSFIYDINKIYCQSNIDIIIIKK